MKKEYSGLEAIKVEFSSQILTTASPCPAIYMTHTVTETITQCTEAQSGEVPSTGSWTVRYNSEI